MGKTVLITGASRGIGAACARRFAHANWNVVICSKSSKEELFALADEIGAEPFICDVAEEKEVNNMFAAAEEKFQSVDALVLNAGVAWTGLFQDMTENEWDSLMGTNLKGAFLCAKRGASAMIRKKEGSIVCISSIWGIRGASCEVAYSASKAGLIGFTKALAKELGPSGIRVNCVAPGVIDTVMNAHLNDEDIKALTEETPLCRIGTPEEVAEAVFTLTESKASFITGAVLTVDGGISI